MPSRFEYERAVRASDLPPLSRLLTLTLATWADVKAGVIPDRLTPSLSTLEEATGMDRSTVRRHLNKIEAAGWVVRNRPDPAAARAKKSRTRYQITIPKGIEVPEGEAVELGAESTKARGTQPLVDSELGAHSPLARGTQPLELGAENPITRGTQPPKSSYGPERSDEYQQPALRGGIPDRLEPLRTALAAAGLGAVAWDIKKFSDWERIRRQMDRLGIDVMVHSAALAARNRGEPDSVTAWIGRWESLADPQEAAQSGNLPVAVGQVVPINGRPSTTDQRVQQALEAGRRLQAQADARQEQP